MLPSLSGRHVSTRSGENPTTENPLSQNRACERGFGFRFNRTGAAEAGGHRGDTRFTRFPDGGPGAIVRVRRRPARSIERLGASANGVVFFLFGLRPERAVRVIVERLRLSRRIGRLLGGGTTRSGRRFPRRSIAGERKEWGDHHARDERPHQALRPEAGPGRIEHRADEAGECPDGNKRSEDAEKPSHKR